LGKAKRVEAGTLRWFSICLAWLQSTQIFPHFSWGKDRNNYQLTIDNW